MLCLVAVTDIVDSPIPGTLHRNDTAGASTQSGGGGTGVLLRWIRVASLAMVSQSGSHLKGFNIGEGAYSATNTRTQNKNTEEHEKKN